VEKSQESLNSIYICFLSIEFYVLIPRICQNRSDICVNPGERSCGTAMHGNRQASDGLGRARDQVMPENPVSIYRPALVRTEFFKVRCKPLSPRDFTRKARLGF